MGTADGMPMSALLVVGQWLGPRVLVCPRLSAFPLPSGSHQETRTGAVEAAETKPSPAQGTTGGWPLWEAGLQLRASVSLEIGQSPGWEWRLSFLNC